MPIDIPQAIANVLKDESCVPINYLGELRYQTIPAQEMMHPATSEIFIRPARQMVRFRMSSKLRELLSEGRNSAAASDFEQVIADDDLSFDFAGSIATMLSISEDEAQSAIRAWLASLVEQLMDAESTVYVAPLGYFRIHRYQEMVGFNPKTKQPILGAASCSLFLLPSIRLYNLLSDGPKLKEVSAKQFSSAVGDILSLKECGPKEALELLSQVEGLAPGISPEEVEGLEAITRCAIPSLLKQLLVRFSTDHPLFGVCGAVASSPQAFASLIDTCGDSGDSQPKAIPFVDIINSGERAWFVCACEKCSEDPQVFAAQQIPKEPHEDSETSLRLSKWIVSRVLLHRLTAFKGCVLRPEDAMSLFSYLAALDDGEGTNFILPV